MAANADVRSLEQLEVFLSQMAAFRVQLIKEIENLEVELRRMSQWLCVEAQTYWQDELKLAQRKFVDAQQTLSRCMSYVRSDERRPCTEEKKRLQKTSLRRELCESKLKTVRAAAAHWEQERSKIQARVERCRDMASSDLLVAVNHLRGQLERLESYANLRSAGVSNRSTPTSPPATLEQDGSGPEANDESSFTAEEDETP